MNKILECLNRIGNEKLGTISIRNILHSLVVAAGTAAVSYVVGAIQAGTPLSVSALWLAVSAALSAQVAYLGKKIFTNSNGELFKGEK